jgi:hypothetical protein
MAELLGQKRDWWIADGLQIGMTFFPECQLFNHVWQHKFIYKW